ncbi:MAG: family 78 glycoside hydrolase catalytic domain, partial [Clostridia bacterium]|nr:family 78 glycoside hydrolase catalytic domain [Clostridia bacterium]
MQAIHLKTAHLSNPLGINIPSPLLTWRVKDGIRQRAYQIMAFCDNVCVWDSGRTESSEMQRHYDGPVKSRQRISWQVKLWDENAQEGPWSKSAWFEYALLDPQDYHAKWIDPEITSFDAQKPQPASVLRKEFVLQETHAARLYATAHGMYVLYINGKRVTGNVLTPGTSEYWYRLPYQTFDVTAYLHTGNNVLTVVLGDGWWRGSNGNTGSRNVFGSDIALWLQMDVNGQTVLISDETWQAAQDGPIVFNDLQLGERVDARKVPSAFHGVKVQDYGTRNFLCANTVPIIEKETFAARLIVTPSGKKVLDFGQNMAGYVSFRIHAQAGQTIRLTHGECLDQNGDFTDQNLQTVGRKSGELHQVIEYTCRDGLNEYSPTLCIFGFQYVWLESELELDGSEFIAHAVYSDMAETASFTCDHPLVNQFFRNAMWSEKSNFVDIPTDCPQRERSGWTGDAGLFCKTGLTLMDAYPVYARWLAECRADQYPDGRVYNMSPRRTAKPSVMDKLYDGSTAWGDTSILVPYTMYKLYGDKQILEENYQFMKNWLTYCERKAKKSRFRNLLKKNKHKKYIIDTGIHWGEWLEAGISMADSVKDMLLNGVPDIATAYFGPKRMLRGLLE